MTTTQTIVDPDEASVDQADQLEETEDDAESEDKQVNENIVGPEGEQAQLAQMPPPGPPSLKKMAALLTAVDKIYPDDFGPTYQWDRFQEICQAAFRGGIRFVIPLDEWEAEQKDREEAAKALGEAGGCGTCGSRINTLDGSCTNADCQSDGEED